MFNYILISELSQYGLELEYWDKNELEREKEYLKKFSPLCGLVEKVTITAHEGKYSIVHPYVFLKYKGVLLKAEKERLHSNFSFTLAEEPEYRYSKRYRSDAIPPKKVGNPSEKNMDNWISYLLEEKRKKEDCSQYHVEVENKYREKLNSLGELVVWIDEKTATITKGIIRFKIIFNENKIYESLEFANIKSLSLDDFLALDYINENFKNGTDV